MRLFFALLLWLMCIAANAAPPSAPPPKPRPGFMLPQLPAWSFTFSPDNRWLAGGYSSARLALWDVRTGHLRWRKSLGGADGEILAVAFSPDGRFVAFGQNNSTSHPGAVNLYQAPSGRSQRVLDSISSPVTALAFSPDSTILASGSLRVEDQGVSNEVNVWKWRHEGRHRTLLWRGGGALALAFSPDGRRLDCVGADGTLLVRDVRRQKQREFFLLDRNGFSTAAFSKDGRTLAAGNGDSPLHEDQIKLWDVGTGKFLRTLNRPHHVLRTVALTPDGQTVAVGYTNGEIVLWDAHSGQVKAVLGEHHLLVRVIAFTSDARQMVSGDSDGKVMLWRLRQ